MTESKRQILNNGQAANIEDLNAGWETAALADDRVLAELLRMPPYGSDTTNVFKSVMPHVVAKNGSSTVASAGIVQPSGSADAKIRVYPFRMLVGTRAAASAGAKANWRDIRSGLFVGNTAGDATTIYSEATLTANSSGNPRWDMVYATMTINANASAVTRKLKSPTTGAVTTTSTVVEVTQNIAVTVQAGTPGATPAFAALPADTATTFNVLLGYVRVPNGFGAASTVATNQIVEGGVNGAYAPAPLSTATGAGVMFPAGINGVLVGSTALNAWGSAGTRPETYLPAHMMGFEAMPILVDASTPVHTNGTVIDNLRNWRNRYFMAVVTVTNSGTFASQNPGAGAWPIGEGGAARNATFVGQSFVNDATLVASTATVADINQANVFTTLMAASSRVGLYVNASGQLLWYANGTPSGCKFMIWLFATAQMPNF